MNLNTEGKFNKLSFSSTNKNTQYIKKIKEFIKKNKSKNLKVLDIGCGDGSILEALRNDSQTFEYTGIDVSEVNISEALKRRKDEKTEFVLSDYLKKSFISKFDLIISYSTLNLICDPVTLMKKMQSELHQDGTMLICVPYSCLRTRIYIILRYIIKFLSRFGLLSFIELLANRLLNSLFSKDQINQSLIYMTIIPKFIWNNKTEEMAKVIGLKVSSENKEYPKIIGKLSHKIIILKKIIN
tara:strand:- start:713 stop:1435 length:723 start_codon:yes stop_codon:yes gene_type:complete